MISNFTKQFLSIALSNLLFFTAVLDAVGQQPESTGPPQSSGQPASLSSDELQNLVAPIALYPDALVAQILGAATFPDQVADADNYLHSNQNLTGTALEQAVN